MRISFISGIIFLSTSLPLGILGNIANASEQAKTDIGFCLKDEGSIDLTVLTKNEVGVVVTNVGASATNPKGQIAISANNYFGKPGTSSFFKSGMGLHRLAGGSCYNIAIMTKPSQPDGSAAWSCVGGNLNVTGKVLLFSAGVVSAQVIGVVHASENAPVINCPPTGN